MHVKYKLRKRYWGRSGDYPVSGQSVFSDQDLASVTALLLPADVSTALQLISQFHGLNPTLHSTDRALLLVVEQPIAHPPLGFLALREQYPGLFVPTDAELVPGLLPDEAAGLTKEHWVIVLPGPSFQRAERQALSLRTLIDVPKINESSWRPLPVPLLLADRIHSLSWDLPPDSIVTQADQIIDQGGFGKNPKKNVDGILPRPPGSNPILHMGGKAIVATGKLLGGIGMMIGMKGLAAVGAHLINKGVNWTPRLLENLLGKQEAALRALLRQFQKGNIEEALRRALPVGDQDHTQGVYNSAKLPTHSLWFNLSKLFSFANSTHGAWLGGGEVMLKLTAEYRKQAELAEKRGDYRRAAYIYAKLLKDFHSAAAVLARGGLHQDAALIYLRLDNLLKAADQFEKAGLFDRALDLYRRANRHDLAGILLTNLDLCDEALIEFQIAAESIVETARDYFRAGKLLEDYAKRTDLALQYYQRGWSNRPTGSAVPCAIRIAQLSCLQQEYQAVEALLDEGIKYFADSTDDQLASRFFNELISTTDQYLSDDASAVWRGSIRDQILLRLSGRLQAGSQSRLSPPGLVSVLFPGKTWKAGHISDAECAYRSARKQLTLANSPPPVRIPRRIVLSVKNDHPTCIVMAKQYGWLFVGYASGEIVCVRLHLGDVQMVTAAPDGLPLGLAVNNAGDVLYELRRLHDQRLALRQYSFASGQFHSQDEWLFDEDTTGWLSPRIEMQGKDHIVVYGVDDSLVARQEPNRELWRWSRKAGESPFTLALTACASSKGVVLYGFDGYYVKQLSAESQCGSTELHLGYSHLLSWSAKLPTLEQSLPAIDYLDFEANGLGVVGVSSGRVYLTLIKDIPVAPRVMTVNPDHKPDIRSFVSTGKERYFAATFVRPGKLVALTDNGLHWYDFNDKGLKLLSIEEVPIGSAQACFADPAGNTLAVVKRNVLCLYSLQAPTFSKLFKNKASGQLFLTTDPK